MAPKAEKPGKTPSKTPARKSGRRTNKQIEKDEARRLAEEQAIEEESDDDGTDEDEDEHKPATRKPKPTSKPKKLSKAQERRTAEEERKKKEQERAEDEDNVDEGVDIAPPVPVLPPRRSSRQSKSPERYTPGATLQTAGARRGGRATSLTSIPDLAPRPSGRKPRVSPTKPGGLTNAPPEPIKEEPESPDGERKSSPSKEPNIEVSDKHQATPRHREKEEKKKEAAEQKEREREKEAKEMEQRKAENAGTKEKEDETLRKKEEAGTQNKEEDEAARRREEAQQKERDEENRKADEFRKQAAKKEAERRQQKDCEQRAQVELARRLERGRERSQVIEGSPERELSPLLDYEDYEQTEQPGVAVNVLLTAGPNTAVGHVVPATTIVVKKDTRVKTSGAGDPGSSPSSGSHSRKSESEKSHTPKPPISPSPRGPSHSRSSHSTESIQSRSSVPLTATEFRRYEQRYGSDIEDIRDSVGRRSAREPNILQKLNGLENGQVDLQQTQKIIQECVDSLRDNVGQPDSGGVSIHEKLSKLQEDVSGLETKIGTAGDRERQQRHMYSKWNELSKAMKAMYTEASKEGFKRLDKIEGVGKSNRNWASHTDSKIGTFAEARAQDAQETARRLEALEKAQRQQGEAQREHQKETREQFNDLLDAITSSRKRKRGHGGGEHEGRGDGDGDGGDSQSGSESEGDDDGREGRKKRQKSDETKGHYATDAGRSSAGEIEPAGTNAQATQSPGGRDSEGDHEMLPLPSSVEDHSMPLSPTSGRTKRSSPEVNGGDDGEDHNGSPPKKPKTQSFEQEVKNDTAGRPSKAHQAQTLPPILQVKPLDTPRLRRQRDDLAHDFGLGKPSESEPALPPQKRATFKPRPKKLHKLTKEDQAASESQPAPQGRKGTYAIESLMPRSPPLENISYQVPRPGILGIRPIPAPRPPLPRQEDGYPTPGRFGTGRVSVQLGGAINVVPQSPSTRLAGSGPSQAGNPPPEGSSPNINLVYQADGEILADYGDSTLGLETPIRVQIDGNGEFPIITADNGGQTDQRAPFPPMTPELHAPTMPSSTERVGRQGANATPHTPTPGRKKPKPVAGLSRTVPRVSTDRHTPRAPGPVSADRMINNHGGAPLPFVEGPKKESSRKKKVKTPATATPSKLREVKNVSPSTSSSPSSPVQPLVPTEKNFQLESEDSSGSSSVMYDPEDTFDDGNLARRYYNSLDPINEFSDDEDAQNLGGPRSESEDEIQDPELVDDDTFDGGNPARRYYNSLDPFNEFSDDEDAQNLGGPRSESEDELQDPELVDEDTGDGDGGRQYPGLDDIEDDSRFLDEDEVEDNGKYSALQASFLDDSLFHDKPEDDEAQGAADERTGSGATAVDENMVDGRVGIQMGGIDDDPVLNDREELERARKERAEKAKKEAEKAHRFQA